MKSNIWFSFILSVTLLFSGCAKKEHTTPEPKICDKTVLFYIVAENSLYRFVQKDVMEILEGCCEIPDNSKVVLYVDDLDLPRIYTITNATKAVSMYYLTPEYNYDEDPNSCSPDVLRQVMRYVVGKHPAKKYGMVLWSHGSGWVPGNGKDESLSARGRMKTFGVDNQHNSPLNDCGYELDVMEMAKVLREFSNMEFLMFDACFMQTIETAYELRNITKYIIGSPSEIPGPGAPYDVMMKPMLQQDFNPDELARIYCETYRSDIQQQYGALISSINTSKLEELAAATKKALQGISLRDGKFTDVQNYFWFDKWDGESIEAIPDYYDMKSIMQENLPQDRYAEWEKVFSETVKGYATDWWYSSYSGRDGGYIPVDQTKFGGVSMYVPLQKYMDMKKPFVDYYYKTSWWNAIKN